MTLEWRSRNRNERHHIGIDPQINQAATAGKQGLLVGDLNMTNREADVHWLQRHMLVDSFVRAVKDAERAAGGTDAVRPDVVDFAGDLEAVWPGLRQSLLRKEHRQIAYANARNEMVNKWRVVARHLHTKDPKSGERKEITLGKPMWSESQAMRSYNVRGCGVLEDGTIVFDRVNPLTGCSVTPAYVISDADALQATFDGCG